MKRGSSPWTDKTFTRTDEEELAYLTLHPHLNPSPYPPLDGAFLGQLCLDFFFFFFKSDPPGGGIQIPPLRGKP